MLVLLIYIYWCPTRFPCKMMFVCFNSNTKGVTSGTGTANSSGAHEFTLCFLSFTRQSFDLLLLNTSFSFSNLTFLCHVDTNTRFTECCVNYVYNITKQK